MSDVRHKVFISYVREDREEVDRIARALRRAGFEVWLDRTHLLPGVRWKDEIRRQIRGGLAFLACFSNSYHARDVSYMNEELTTAIDEIRA